MPHWTLVIIGGGAAGLSAAAAAAAAASGQSCLLIDRMGGGGELMNLGTLHDLGEDLTGPDLMARLQEDAMTAGAELGLAEVTGLARTSTGWCIETDDETHTAAAVILATGLAPGTLGLSNEAEFEGMGLSHCAACDGPLYAGQAVVVAGADRWAVQEAVELAAATCRVTLITQNEPVPVADTVTVIAGRITALEGANGLDSITVQTGSAPAQRIETPVVFLQTGRRPAVDFAPPALARDADGRLITDGSLRTNLPGLFAAGDTRAGASRTLAAAMADGRLAAESALSAAGLKT